MNEYVVYSGIAALLLVASLTVPGLKIIAEALFKGFVDLVTELIKHKSTFIIWFIKTLASDHARLLEHATQSRESIDPTQSIRRKALGYDDEDETQG